MSNAKKVVIIDRDSDTFTYLAKFIPLLGKFEVEQASHLIEALAKTNAYKPELIIYNLSITQAHARNIFLSELRAKQPGTKILAIVSNEIEKAPLEALGVDNVLIEPLNLSELSEVIKTMLPKNDLDENQDETARLLIADDEPDISSYLKDIFADMGINVYTAQDGKEALDIFREYLCNLVIVDLHMPNLSGPELIKMLQMSNEPPKPKDIIAMTSGLGDSLPELKRQNFSVFEKPLNMNTLEERILEDCKKFHLSFLNKKD